MLQESLLGLLLQGGTEVCAGELNGVDDLCTAAGCHLLDEAGVDSDGAVVVGLVEADNLGRALVLAMIQSASAAPADAAQVWKSPWV